MLDEILESATTVTSDSEDYRGEDGLLYCGKCHTPREAYFSKGITLLGKNASAAAWSVSGKKHFL